MMEPALLARLYYYYYYDDYVVVFEISQTQNDAYLLMFKFPVD